MENNFNEQPVSGSEYDTYSYGQADDYVEVQNEGMNVWGLIAMIFGILSMISLTCYCCFGVFAGIGSGIFGLVALILGIIGMKKMPYKKGMAVAGLVMGIIGVVVGAVSLVVGIVMVFIVGIDLMSYMDQATMYSGYYY